MLRRRSSLPGTCRLIGDERRRPAVRLKNPVGQESFLSSAAPVPLSFPRNMTITSEESASGAGSSSFTRPPLKIALIVVIHAPAFKTVSYPWRLSLSSLFGTQSNSQYDTVSTTAFSSRARLVRGVLAKVDSLLFFRKHNMITTFQVFSVSVFLE
jgi:hypothetical protein